MAARSFLKVQNIGLRPCGIGATRQMSEYHAQKWDNLIVEKVKPFVYNVQLNRPKKMNALNKELWCEIGSVFHELDSDPDCRAIVLSGNGKMFCAGIDLSTLMEMGQAAGMEGDVARKAK